MRRSGISCLTITLSLFCCLFLSCKGLCESRTERDTTAKYVLAPQPQEISYLQGSFKPKKGQFIFLDTNSCDKLTGTGRIVQESLSQIGTRWELTAAQGNQPERTGVKITVDAAQINRPQGYRLTISENQISITANDAEGAFYAAQTLKQICRQRTKSQGLACIDINDWPDFGNRGVLIDISQDKVPTMKTLYELVEMLSELKVNHLQLYMEHTFAYREHRVVWDKADPMTGEEIRALDAYCKERFIELVPNQNSFAHMQRWLKHKEYAHLAEKEDIAFCLSPAEPGSIELIAGLYDELLPNFSSRQFNIGCDETFELGTGKSKELCEKLGKGRVYLNFLLEIHKQVQRHGRKMQFWGDIILNNPELIDELPKDTIAMVWGYEGNHPFSQQCPKFAASGIPFYVCPGTSSWGSIAGRTDNAIANMRNAAVNGLSSGAKGYLNTDWGDDGHWQPLLVSYLGYAYGAGVSWSEQSNQNNDMARVLDLHFFRDKAGVMGRLVYDLGNTYKQTGVPMANRTILFYLLQSPDSSFSEGPCANLKIDNLRKTQDYIDRVMLPLRKARMERPDARQIADEISNAAAMLRHSCSLAIARLQIKDAKISSIPKDTRKKLAAELKKIIAEHKRLWLLRNREGGLADSAGRLEKIVELYQAY